MKSTYSIRFTDDVDAKLYDEEVKKETHPLYAGYSAVLRWVAAQIRKDDRVLDLGCGTGNTALGLPHAGEIICVDLSPRMIDCAREKLAARSAISYVTADMLGYFEEQRPQIDAVVSTYAVHYLTDEEKYELFRCVRDLLAIGGRAVFGDLMVRNENDVSGLRERFATLNPAIASQIREKSFWSVEEASFRLSRLGFAVQSERLSDLAWGIIGIVKV